MKTTLMVVLCSAAILASGCATSHSHAAAWEYKVLSGNFEYATEKQLNELAGEGWVVVSASSTVQPGMSPQAFVILKRRK